jgi:hypothetical protein
MRLMRVHALEPGAVLARPVRDAVGTTLCEAGAELTAERIRQLRDKEVTTVVVAGGGPDAGAYHQRLALLEERFQRVDDPVLTALKTRAASLLRGWAGDAS